VSRPYPRFKVAKVFPLYDPSLGEGGALRSVVDGGDYLRAVQLLIRYRLDVKRLSKRRDAPVQVSEKTLTDIANGLQERLHKAEAQLWLWSDGHASYFEDHPQAAPIASLREIRE
jgi:hypothetical protein